LSGHDIAEIVNVLSLYPHIVDDETQYHRVADVFADDAIYDASHFGLGRHVGLAAIEEYLANAQARKDDPNHPFAHNTVNSHVYDLAESTARAISRCLGVYLDGRSAIAVYHDRFVRTARGWRIAERVMAPLTGSGGR